VLKKILISNVVTKRFSDEKSNVKDKIKKIKAKKKEI
jgi:hypothetical protein